MDAEANVEPHGALMGLYHQIKDCESWLLHQQDLQKLGVCATQVALTAEETLQFEPCFFRAHPEKLIPICYFNAPRDEDDHRPDPRLDTLPENPFPDRHPLPTNPCPTFEAILKEAQEESPDGD